MLCQPIIGVIIADGSIVEIGYYAVTADHLPQLQSVLDTFMSILGYHDVTTGESMLTRMSVPDKCTPSPTSFALMDEVDS